MKMPISSVQTLIKKWEMKGSVDTKPQSGRPTDLSPNCQEKCFGCKKKPTSNFS